MFANKLIILCFYYLCYAECVTILAASLFEVLAEPPEKATSLVHFSTSVLAQLIEICSNEATSTVQNHIENFSPYYFTWDRTKKVCSGTVFFCDMNVGSLLIICFYVGDDIDNFKCTPGYDVTMSSDTIGQLLGLKVGAGKLTLKAWAAKYINIDFGFLVRTMNSC